MLFFKTNMRQLVLFSLLTGCTVRSGDAPAPATPQPAPVGSTDAPVVAPDAPLASAERPALCSLPPVQGRCRAFMRSFHWDPQASACRYFVYGGCDGNENRFGSPGECLAACAKTPELVKLGESWSLGQQAIGCKLGSLVVANGGRVASEDGKTTCTCEEGQLKQCNQPLPCAAGSVLGTSCAQGGAADGCVVVETACLTTCKTDQDCSADEQQKRCIEGKCAASFP